MSLNVICSAKALQIYSQWTLWNISRRKISVVLLAAFWLYMKYANPMGIKRREQDKYIEKHDVCVFVPEDMKDISLTTPSYNKFASSTTHK